MVPLLAPSRPAAAGPRLLVGRTIPCADPARPVRYRGNSPAPTRDAMAPPEVAAMTDDAMGLTQRDLLRERREDIRSLKATADAIARDQAPGCRHGGTRRRSGERA